MKKVLLLICLAFNALFTKAQGPEDYILNYAFIAISEMEQHRIPASITLAQGLLESRYGTSQLTTKSNNHFGIKCHSNWMGGRVYHDDDEAQECFRKYTNPEQSFEDHSDFLLRKRYAKLFQLDVLDYKNWAKGLKKAGYATDKEYANKLIKLIEKYELYKFDTMPLESVHNYVYQERNGGRPMMTAMAPVKHTTPKPIYTETVSTPVQTTTPKVVYTETVATPVQSNTPRVVYTEAVVAPVQTNTPKVVYTETAPSQPIYQPAKQPINQPIRTVSNSVNTNYSQKTLHSTIKSRGVSKDVVDRAVFYHNDVQAVHSAQLDTPNSIAKMYKIDLNRLTSYNEWDTYRNEFRGGMTIYLQPKRKKTRNKKVKNHTVLAGETMYQIAQRYGLQTKSLYELNAMDYSSKEQPEAGAVISLRKKLSTKPKPNNKPTANDSFGQPSNTLTTEQPVYGGPAGSPEYTNYNTKPVIRTPQHVNNAPRVIKPANQPVYTPQSSAVRSNNTGVVILNPEDSKTIVSNGGRAIIYDNTPAVNQRPVPVYRGTAYQTTATVNTSAQPNFNQVDVTQPNTTEGYVTYYTVTKGDTLYSISKKHKVTVSQLQQWNKLNGTTIKTGQRLTIKR